MARTPNISLFKSPLLAGLVLSLMNACTEEIRPGSADQGEAMQGHIFDGRPASAAYASGQPLLKPTSGRHLLFNMKVALQQGLLLPAAFYTEANLAQFFGTSRAHTLLMSDINILIMLRGLSYVPVRDDALSSISVTRSLINSENHLSANGKIYAGIGVLCSCQLRIEDIEAVFGKIGMSVAEERVVADAPGHSFPALPHATDPMGNKRVGFEIATFGAYLSTLSVSFDPDGNVKEIDAKQWEQP
jgi:hypothetical protein